jgi:hypothetical protein
MPSIGDVANDIETRLDDIKAYTLATRDNTNTIASTTQSGFTNLAQGLAALIQLQLQNNDLLASNDQQNKTIICWLTNIADVLCDIKRNTDAEVKLQGAISTTLHRLNEVLELVHAREALDVEKREELQKRVEECCPKKDPEVQPCFQECESPRLPDYHPVKIDWKPISYPRPAGR